MYADTNPVVLRYRVCVINSSHSFHWTFLKPCISVADILKMCMWVLLMEQELILTDLQPIELSHFRQLFAL